MTDEELLDQLANAAKYYHDKLHYRHGLSLNLTEQLVADWHYATVSCYASAGLMGMSDDDSDEQSTTTMSA